MDNIDVSKVKDHTTTTIRDAVLITGTMIAALLAAEGRMPDPFKIFKFLAVFTLLVVICKLNQTKVADQIMTASAIAVGSKLVETITK